MYLKIELLELANIRCFNKLNIDFTSGVNVITGPNGSGKSTILTSIGYGLFGANYLYGLPISTDDLILRGKTKGRIKLTFSTPEGRFTSIHRINLNGQNSWHVYQGTRSSPVTEMISESREFIQLKLGDKIDHTIFKNALCSRQGELGDLLESTPSQRRDQIRKILGLDNFDRAYSLVSKYHKEVNRNIEQIEGKIEVLENVREDPKQISEEIKELEGSTNKIKSTMAKAKEKFDIIDEEVSTLQEKSNTIISLKKEQGQKKQEFKTLEDEIGQTLEEKHAIETKLDQSNMDKTTATEMVDNLSEELEKLRQDKQELEWALKEYNQYSKEKEKLDKRLQGFKQELKAIKSKLENNFEDFSLQDVKEEISELQTNHRYRKEKFNALKNEISTLEELYQNNKTQLDKLQAKTKKYKKEFREVFDAPIDDYTEIERDLKKRIKTLNSAHENLKQYIQDNIKEISYLQGRSKMLTNTIELLDKTPEDNNCPICLRSFQQDGVEEIKEFHEKELRGLKEETEKTTKILEKQKENLSRIQQKEKNIEKKYNRLENFSSKIDEIQQMSGEQEILNEKITKEKSTIQEKKEEFQKIDKTSMEKLQEKISELQGSIKEYEELTAKEKELENEIIKVKEDLKENNEKLQKYNQKQMKEALTQIQKKMSKNSSRINLINKGLLDVLQKLSSKKKQQEKITTQLEKNKERLQQMSNEFSDEKFKQKKSLLEELRNQLAQLKAKKSKNNEKIQELNKRLGKAEENRKQLQEMRKQIDNYQKILPKAMKLKEIYKNTPNHLISQTSADISTYLTNMIKRLLPGRGFEKAKFKHDGDIVLYNNGSEVEKSTLSGGEKTVLALALRLALADYVAPLQFLILDEPTNHLDRHRVEEFMEIIDRDRIFSATSGQLVLVTHREEFDRNAQNSIKLTIDNGKRQLD